MSENGVDIPTVSCLIRNPSKPQLFVDSPDSKSRAISDPITDGSNTPASAEISATSFGIFTLFSRFRESVLICQKKKKKKKKNTYTLHSYLSHTHHKLQKIHLYI